MLRIKKELVPLYGGDKKKGFIHTVLVDAKGYDNLIKHIDKDDVVTSEFNPYPPFTHFAGFAYQRTHKAGHNDWWVVFAYKKGQKININVISHEALHITRMILDSRGVIFDPNNDEPYTYMQGWVTEAICRGLPKNIIKI